MNDETTQFLKQLEEEIKSTKEASEKTEMMARLEETMSVYQGEDKLISSEDIVEKIKNQKEEVKYKTGFETLDKILDGFRENQLVVLAAPTKSGKTQFCVELTSTMSETNPVWLPFEESAEELIRKFLDRKENPPMFYTPEVITGNTTGWVEKKIIEGRVKFNSKLFFIDHLHFLVPFNSDRLDTRIGETMRKLKQIAKRNNVIIVLIAHLKKTNMLVSPSLEDLRDSSFIAQEADTVILLWRKTIRGDDGQMMISNETLLSVQANRRTGRTGNVQLNFNNGRFYEEAWEYEDV